MEQLLTSRETKQGAWKKVMLVHDAAPWVTWAQYCRSRILTEPKIDLEREPHWENVGRGSWKQSSFTFANGKQTGISVVAGMRVSPKITRWKPLLGFDHIRKRAFGRWRGVDEVVRVATLSEMRLVPPGDSWENVPPLSAVRCGRTQWEARTGSGEEGPHQEPAPRTLTTDTQPRSREKID